jgi:hypothetical protein
MNLLFISVKIVGIIFAVLLFSIFGAMNAKILDFFFLDDKDDDKDYTSIQTILFILKLTVCVAILCFFGRNIIERIPFILENVQGFEFKRLKEIKGGSLLLFFSILFSSAYHKGIKQIKALKL